MLKNDECKRAIHGFSMFMLRRIYWHAQDGKCGICKGPLSKLFGSAKLTFDHVWPKAWSAVGGGNAGKFLGNLLLSHKGCNEKKDDQPPTDEQIAFLNEVNRKLGFLPHETAFWDRPREEKEARG